MSCGHGPRCNENNSMLVSVVIPVHNRPRQVIRAVRSVLAQQQVRLEVIVVDDGSTDATCEALSALRDPRLTVLKQAHRGVSAARNRGLRAAKGEILALLDSDDIWLPRKMEHHLRYHLSGKWRISQTEEFWVRNGRRLSPKAVHAKQEGSFFEDALRLCLISPSCVAFDRLLWADAGPFDESLPACEDYELWLRVLPRYPVGLCRRRLVVKTGGHPDQLSRKIIGLDLYRLHALDKLLCSGELSPENAALTCAALRDKADVYIRGCLKRDKPDEAERIRAWLAPWLLRKKGRRPSNNASENVRAGRHAKARSVDHDRKVP